MDPPLKGSVRERARHQGRQELMTAWKEAVTYYHSNVDLMGKVLLSTVTVWDRKELGCLAGRYDGVRGKKEGRGKRWGGCLRPEVWRLAKRNSKTMSTGAGHSERKFISPVREETGKGRILDQSCAIISG